MFVNLTPHTISILIGDGDRVRIIKPSGQVARVETTAVPLGEVDGIPVSKTEFGLAVGLPDPEKHPCPYCDARRGMVATLGCAHCQGTGSEETLYIVSRLVLEAVKDTRDDVFAPGELVRDDDGRPIGCRGLSR